MGPDPRALGDPRRGGRPRHRSRAGRARHAGDVPGARHHRQGRRDLGRVDRRPGLRGRRRRLVGPRARGLRPRLPRPQRLGSTTSSVASRRCEALSGSRHQGPRRRARQAPRDNLLPAAGGRRPRDRGRYRTRTLRIAAALGDAANVPSARPKLDEHVATLRRHSDTVRITVLDLPTIGTNREDAARVERLRGRTTATAYAERTHAGPAADQRDRWGGLAELGVDTVFLGIPTSRDRGRRAGGRARE